MIVSIRSSATTMSAAALAAGAALRAEGDAHVGEPDRGHVVGAVAGDGHDLARRAGRPVTIRALCSGVTRAKTATSASASVRASSSSASSSGPVITRSPFSAPISAAMAVAVLGMIAGDHDDPHAGPHEPLARCASPSGRTGSAMPRNPRKHRLSMRDSSRSARLEAGRSATASTR